MTLFPAPTDQEAALRSRYLADSVLSATPARLLTMLYDRLMLDLGRAETAQLGGDWAAASEQLLHAQAIVTELSSSLDLGAWDGADGLLGIYTYVSTALINANIRRDPALTREAIVLLEPLRQAWHEAAAGTPAAAPTPVVPGATQAGRGLPANGAWATAGSPGRGSLGFG